MHGFADEIFAKDWAQCSAAIAAPGERRSAGALQLDIAPFAVPQFLNFGGLTPPRSDTIFVCKGVQRGGAKMPIRRYVKNGVTFDPELLAAMSRALEATTNILGIDGDEAKRRDVRQVHHSAGTGRRRSRCGCAS
jgi:hypothetical protein